MAARGRDDLLAALRGAVGDERVLAAVLGLPETAPFDAISVAAAGPAERLGPLLGQLAHGGRLVAPVERGVGDQVLVLLRRSDHERVLFVPLS